MKIAMIASEINPLVKTGGLADVVHALSVELKKKGNDVICVLPYYRVIASKPIHCMTKNERTKPMKIKDLVIDIGARDREDAKKYVKKATKVTSFYNYY